MTKLHINGRMQDNRNKWKSIKKSSKVWREVLKSEKELVKEHIKERERNWGNGHEGKRARKRKKGLEEVRKGGTQIEAREE